MNIPVALSSVAARSLAMALIESSQAPLLLLNRDLTVIAASRSFCSTFDVNPSASTAKFAELGSGEWDVPQLHSLLRATVADNAGIVAFEMDLVREGHSPRKLVVNAHRLDYSDAEELRVVLAVEKLKDDLVREKQIL